MSSPSVVRHATHLGGEAGVCVFRTVQHSHITTAVHGEVQQAHQLLARCLYKCILLASLGHQNLASGSHFPCLATNIPLLLKVCVLRRYKPITHLRRN